MAIPQELTTTKSRNTNVDKDAKERGIGISKERVLELGWRREEHELGGRDAFEGNRAKEKETGNGGREQGPKTSSSGRDTQQKRERDTHTASSDRPTRSGTRLLFCAAVPDLAGSAGQPHPTQRSRGASDSQYRHRQISFRLVYLLTEQLGICSCFFSTVLISRDFFSQYSSSWTDSLSAFELLVTKHGSSHLFNSPSRSSSRFFFLHSFSCSSRLPPKRRASIGPTRPQTGNYTFTQTTFSFLFCRPGFRLRSFLKGKSDLISQGAL
jgi:hypothetical protein